MLTQYKCTMTFVCVYSWKIFTWNSSYVTYYINIYRSWLKWNERNSFRQIFPAEGSRTEGIFSKVWIDWLKFFSSSIKCLQGVSGVDDNIKGVVHHTLYRVFRIDLPSLIPVISKLIRLICLMFSMPKKSKEVKYAIFKISFSPKPAAHLENS